MRVLVFETNLMWSSRLQKSLQALGHEALLRAELPEDADGARVAIVNLGASRPEPGALVARLKELGTFVIGHAGHKEKELMELGRKAGCDLLATNRELTYKIGSLLEKVPG